MLPRHRREEVERALRDRPPFDEELDAVIVQDVSDEELEELGLDVSLQPPGPPRAKTLVIVEGRRTVLDNAEHRLRTFGGEEVGPADRLVDEIGASA